MKYATVVSASPEVNSHVCRAYTVCAADEAGSPKVGAEHVHAGILFEDEAGSNGCSEADLLGIVMHRLAARAQGGGRPHFKSAFGQIELALMHLTATLEVAPVGEQDGQQQVVDASLSADACCA